MPVGVPDALAAETVAVRVTGEFSLMLRDDATRRVEVATTTGFTVTESALEVDGLNEDVPA